MSRRIVLSSAAAVLVLGGAGAFALAQDEDRPISLANSTARYTSPGHNQDGSLTFTTDVTTSEGLKDLKVLAWPADNATFAKNGLTEKDMAEVESAACESTGKDTARCTYRITGPAAEVENGTWYVATLATAKNGDTVLDPKTSTFTVG
ncbi:DUF5707 domain-containing protein [Streptomyces violaceorubidus]